MKPWQCEHIRKNLAELSKLTNFNTTVKVFLEQNEILCKEDVELFNANRTTLGKTHEAYEGYKLLMTRTHAYDALSKALAESRQTDALEILQIGKANHDIQEEPVVQPQSVSLNPFQDPEVSNVSPENRIFRSSASNQPLDNQRAISLNTRLPHDGYQSIADQLAYSKTQILGMGSRGTVCKGTFGQLHVAVKIQSNHKTAENEIKILIRCEIHENIVRYYCSEKTPRGFSIALELCEKYTLADWVENPNCFEVDIDPFDVLRQATLGVGFLHEISILHKNIKPSNILLSIRGNKTIAKLSVFGISQGEPGNMHYFKCVLGWTAPEILEAANLINLEILRTGQSQTALTVTKLTKKIDIFSLGCIYYFVLNDRDLLYNENEGLKNRHIKPDITQFKDEYNSLRRQCNLALVESMIAKDPNIRPNIEFILAHPIFWDHNKLLGDVSNFLTKPVPSNIELCDKCAAKVGTNFVQKISNGTPDK